MVKTWMKVSLYLAGMYNILWGAWVILFPRHVFDLSNISPPLYLEIWQCVGMIVGVYGIGYLIAAQNPFRHWPIILVGLLGKIFGPLGFLFALYKEVFPLKFGITIIFNDLIWWLPFSLILLKLWKSRTLSGSYNCITDFDFNRYDDRKRARFINCLSGVKSTNLIGTINSEGKTNLSIVSSVFHLGASPALVGMIIRPDTARRDSLNNIRDVKEYTINHVHQDIIKKAHQTSARYSEDVSEFDACDLTPHFEDNFHAPFVAESRIKFAVELVREVVIEENGTHLIIGAIKKVFAPSECLLDDGRIDINRAGSIGVAGLDTYLSNEVIGRLSYAKPDKIPEWI